MLAEDGFAADDPDALFQALGSGHGLGLVDIVTEQLGVLDVRQALEAWSVAEVELDDVGQVTVGRVEEAGGLLATSGRSSSIAVMDSTPGQWWILSTRWEEAGLAMA